MIDIRALPSRARVLVVYRGQVLAEELDHAEQELRDMLPVMPPGFDMVCDISAADPLSEEAVAGVRRMAELLIPAGMRTHVRVVGRSGQTALQFQRISRALGYESWLAFSQEEAVDLLDGEG